MVWVARLILKLICTFSHLAYYVTYLTHPALSLDRTARLIHCGCASSHTRLQLSSSLLIELLLSLLAEQTDGYFQSYIQLHFRATYIYCHTLIIMQLISETTYCHTPQQTVFFQLILCREDVLFQSVGGFTVDSFECSFISYC